MKTRLFIQTMAVSVMMLTMTGLMTSCTTNDDNPVTPMPEPEELADATIIWYGAGAGDRDGQIMTNFRQFYHAKPESYDRVNIVAQYKASVSLFSHYYEEDYEFIKQFEGMTDEELETSGPTNDDYLYLSHTQPGATYRFVLNPKKTLHRQLIETKPYGAHNCDFTCPDSLTSFINWAAANYPAKKYILVLADHGGGYFPAEDLPAYATTRGMIYDDGYLVGNDKKCFSAKSLAQAMMNAKVRPEGMVVYLCHMNDIQFLYEVKDVTDYITAATYSIRAKGGAFEAIVDNLAEGQDTRTALSQFVDASMDSWEAIFGNPDNPEKVNYYDLTMTETSRLNDLAPVLREITDRLVNTYQNGTTEQRALIDQCTADAVRVNKACPYYDFYKYIQSFFTALPEVFDQQLYERFQTTFNACIVNNRFAQYMKNHNYKVYCSVNLGVKGRLIRLKNDDVAMWALAYYPNGVMEKYKFVGISKELYDRYLNSYELFETGTWPGTLADTYQQTTFDKLVGWSRWLLINETPPSLYCPSSENYELPYDDLSEIM